MVPVHHIMYADTAVVQNLGLWIRPPQACQLMHTPRSIPPIDEQAQDELAKANNVLLTLTDHLPHRAGFSYAGGEYIDIYIHALLYDVIVLL